MRSDDVTLPGSRTAYVLERFPYTRAWGEELTLNLVELTKQVLLAIAGALPGLVVVAIIFVIAKAVIGLARAFFDRVEGGQLEVKWLSADTVGPTRRIFAFVAWIFALAMAYPYLPGANTDAFKGLSVLVGLMVSLGGAPYWHWHGTMRVSTRRCSSASEPWTA